MSARTSTGSVKSRDFVCPHIAVDPDSPTSVAARQRGVPGFDQAIFSKSRVTLVGAGGINGENGEGFVRKGIGHLEIFDGDEVEITNLNRQRFTTRDIGHNKAIRLAKNLLRDGYLGTMLSAYPYFFQETIEKGITPETDLIVCGVDNDPTRLFIARYAIASGIPVIFSAVSRDANQGYVFIQEPGQACFGCAFPQAIGNEVNPCPNTPAIKDILKVVSGLTLYAADTVLMSRKRDWNYRMVYLAGFILDDNRRVERNPHCPLCSSAESTNHE